MSRMIKEPIYQVFNSVLTRFAKKILPNATDYPKNCVVRNNLIRKVTIVGLDHAHCITSLLKRSLSVIWFVVCLENSTMCKDTHSVYPWRGISIRVFGICIWTIMSHFRRCENQPKSIATEKEMLYPSCVTRKISLLKSQRLFIKCYYICTPSRLQVIPSVFFDEMPIIAILYRSRYLWRMNIYLKRIKSTTFHNFAGNSFWFRTVSTLINVAEFAFDQFFVVVFISNAFINMTKILMNIDLRQLTLKSR